MSHQPQNVKDIFMAAIDIQSAVDRLTFIKQACDGDENLRQRVEVLLAAHDDPESYFDRPAATFDATATFSGDSARSHLSDSSSYHGRFLPGTKLADRYRIVSLLGSGGMGDVYRADDLRLNQPVALKFLPSELAKDQKRLDYFHNEVKLARQISHPNICRVYDIGEVDGHYFISMEYIDGEDLKTLLHRIGRLPNDKGIQIAQQLCAGLAAAHVKGVLHRDLKPANIMIDGQGQVRITDFGLATASDDNANIAGMSGTPAYMAPEQFLRGHASILSDIYSLGLVLYEMFTGKPPHQASSIGELRQLHEDSSVPRGAREIVEEIDPAVESIIARCLDPDPVNRPQSISAVSSSLPGGQPLEAAVAAGETPSPELVAASGGTGVLSSKVATRYLVCVIALLAIALIVIPKTSQIQAIGADQWSSPVLRHRAREILRQLGIEEQPNYTDGFGDKGSDLRYLDRKNKEPDSPTRAELLKEGPFYGLEYWYRESPHGFFVDRLWGGSREDWRSWNRATRYKPAWTAPRMNGVRLTPTGQLRWLRAIPPDTDVKTEPQPEPDWSEWFPESMTGFDLNSLNKVDWENRPEDAFDHYQAWEGTWPNTDIPLKVQAASYRGIPTSFFVFPPDKKFTEEKFFPPNNNNRIAGRIMGWVTFIVYVSPFILAGYHLRRGLGDRRGAFRLAVYCGGVSFIANLLLATHVRLPFEVILLMHMVWSSAGAAFMCWGYYIAIEPLARRYWPSILVSWTRLLRGSFRDPLVGRDLLIGVVVGIALSLIQRVNHWQWGKLPTEDQTTLLDLRSLFGRILELHFHSITTGFFVVTLLIISVMIFRSKKIAPIAIVLPFIIADILQRPLIEIPGNLIVGLTLIFLLIRYGFLTPTVAAFIINLLSGVITMNFDAYYAMNGMVLVAIVLSIAIYGFITSQGNALQSLKLRSPRITTIA